MTNPALAAWIVEHVEAADHDEVVKLWKAIELAAGSVVEALTADGDGEDSPSF